MLIEENFFYMFPFSGLTPLPSSYGIRALFVSEKYVAKKVPTDSEVDLSVREFS